MEAGGDVELDLDGSVYLGGHLGGMRAGDNFGMTGGIVVVGGDAGHRAGDRMRRGAPPAAGPHLFRRRRSAPGERARSRKTREIEKEIRKGTADTKPAAPAPECDEVPPRSSLVRNVG